MIRFLSTTALLLLVTNAGAQSKGEKYTPEGGQYTVRFPGKPKETNQTVKSAVGDLKVFTATYALSDGSAYMVSYNDFPEEAAKDAKTLFDGVREGIKGKDGKVLVDQDSPFGPDKLPAREIEIEKGKQRLRFRVVLRNNRLYQVAAIGSASFASGKDADEFFKSFEVKK